MKYYFSKQDFFNWYKKRYPNADCKKVECDYFNNISDYEQVNAFIRSVLGYNECSCQNYCTSCCEIKNITEIACLSFYELKKNSKVDSIGISKEMEAIIMNRLASYTDLGVY